MLRIPPEIIQVETVLLGKFNPGIFSPRWFSSNKLIRESVADSAELRVTHPELSDFTAGWLRIQTTRDVFRAASSQPPFVRLRDLVYSTFHECLIHTPHRAFGINYSVHFLVPNMAVRDRLGTTLVPLEPWGPWQKQLDLGGRFGGMSSVRVSQLQPADRDHGGEIHITVEPSKRVGTDPGTGVFVNVNNHFGGGESDNAERLMSTLVKEFEDSLAQGEQIVDHIMSLVQPES